MSEARIIEQPEDGEGEEAVASSATVPVKKQGDAAADASLEASVELSGEPFDAPVRSDPLEESEIDALVLSLDGYAGPLDVLLDLARSQKVDLRKISMLALVEQYLQFVEAVKERNLELAADYLVMAAWLAFLKSKLLLPVVVEDGEEPTADEMAARLAFQLQRLEAMRNSADALLKLPRLQLDLFPRGMPEGVRVKRTPDWQADIYDLLKAYTTQRVAAVERHYKPEAPRVLKIEEARLRLARILGEIPDWIELTSLSKFDDVDAPSASVIASAFNAALEFAKDGRIDLRQLGSFEPIYIRGRTIDASEQGAPAAATGN